MSDSINPTRHTDSASPDAQEVFNYLSAITSIILGLGLSHALSGIAWLIDIEQLFGPSWLYTGWVLLLPNLYVIYWWAFWDYRKLFVWTFPGFIGLLVGPTFLYLITTMLIPGSSERPEFNAAVHYEGIRPWFFSIWCVLQVWGILLAPTLKDGLNKQAFIGKHKIAQYVSLVALVSGLLNALFSFGFPYWDHIVLVTFWLVLAYLVLHTRNEIKAS